MMGTINCIYETPCGWCFKWDKRCDRKIPERGHRIEVNPVDDAMDSSLIASTIMCTSESDHDWVASLSSEPEWRCRKCGATKTVSLPKSSFARPQSEFTRPQSGFTTVQSY